MKITLGQTKTHSNGFRLKFLITAIFIFSTFAVNSFAQSPQLIKKDFDEDELRIKFESFIDEVDASSLSKKYPEIVKKILSHQPRQQEIALKMLSESQDITSIPWILLLLNSDDKYVRTYAGYSLKEIVSSIALLRRDMKFPRFTVLKPLPKNAVDLKPMAWIVLKLLRTEDPNSIAYAITMARYLNLYEFESEIIKHQTSIHPAVTDTIKWAVKELELQKKYDSNELKEEK